MTSVKFLRWPVISIFTILLLIQACKVSFNFTGGTTASDLKTFTVYYFPNRADLVNPSLSQQLTEYLQDKFTRQTSLDMVTEGGDLEFEGQITDYSTQPMNITQGDVSAQTRLTITISVKYTNNKNHEDDWEKSFSAYEDYDSSQSLSAVEDELNSEIIAKLADDIFNESFANW